MNKTDKPDRPRKGGSYTRHPETGKLKRRHFTKPGQAKAATQVDESEASDADIGDTDNTGTGSNPDTPPTPQT